MQFVKLSSYLLSKIRMKKCIFLWFWLGLVAIAQSQTITIIDQSTGEGLESVTLRSERPKAFAVSNSRGEVALSAFAGAERVVVQRLGFRSQTLSYEELAAGDLRLALVPAPTQFDEVVVSATRWTQAAQTVPSRIATISREQVALFNPQTAADMLGSSGEVFVQKSQQGGGSPMIRGFSANRLLYAVDGVRMNSAIFRSGNLQQVISLDPFAIESTEVFFGPGAVIYGSDAIGGVMSFQTLRPQLSLSDEPLIRGGAVSRYASANNELSGHFDVNIGWQKWALLTSISHNRFGDLRMGRHGLEEYLKPFFVQRIDSVDRVVANPNPLVQTPTGYSQTNVMQKLRFRPNGSWDFEYGFHYSETSEYSRYDRLIELLPNGLPRSAVWNYGPQIWMMNLLSVSHTANNRLYDRATLRLAQQYFEESRIDRNFSGGQRFRLRTQLERVNAYSLNLDFERSRAQHHLYYGLEYVQNEVRSEGSAIDIRNNTPIPTPDRYPNSNWSSYAAYLNYQWQPSERFLVQAGARYNAFDVQSNFERHLSFFPFDFSRSSLQNAALTGSLGLVYMPDETWKLSANLGTGFRAPNVDDIGKIFDIAAGEVVVPNPDLSPEYAYNAELNIAKIWGEVLKLDLTGFYTYLDGAMVRRPFGVGGQDSINFGGERRRVLAIQNAAYGSVYGFSAGLELRLPSGFGLSSRYNYQRGEEEMDSGELSRSRHAAPAFGMTTLSYHTDKLRLQLYAVYSAEVSFANLNVEERQKPAIYARDAEGNPFSPAWYTLNFKAMYALSPQLSVSAGIENLSDQRYRPYSSGLVAPGRNFILSLRAGF
jgi:hemoglobin/transferrin/lactoferrin receptor protein